MKLTLIVALALSATVGCVGAPSDDRPREVKAAADRQQAVRLDDAGDASARAGYLSKIEVKNVTSHRGLGLANAPVALVNGEVKNVGDRSVDKVTVTIYFLDAANKPAHEDTCSPVFVGTFGDTVPLKPNYGVTWNRGFNNVPDDWSGNVEVKVTDVVFSKPAPVAR